MDEAAKRISQLKTLKMIALLVFITSLFLVLVVFNKIEIETDTLIINWGFLSVGWTILIVSILCVLFWLFHFFLIVYCSRILTKEADPETYYYVCVEFLSKKKGDVIELVRLRSAFYMGDFKSAEKIAEKFIYDKNLAFFLTAINYYSQCAFFLDDLDKLIRLKEILIQRDKATKNSYKNAFNLISLHIDVLTEILKGNYFKASEFAKSIKKDTKRYVKDKKNNKVRYVAEMYYSALLLNLLGEKGKAKKNLEEVVNVGNKLFFVEKANKLLQE